MDTYAVQNTQKPEDDHPYIVPRRQLRGGSTIRSTIFLAKMDAMDNNANGTLDLEYQHEPLPDASSYIRLLTTNFYDEDDRYTFDCELTTWRIDASPTFHAISYNWGDPSQTAVLRINGRSLCVTKNCEIALAQAKLCPSAFPQLHRWKRDLCYYWCDAVCIDQRNKEEKEAQVASMGQIYRRAKHVFACLGPPVEDADSPFLFRKLRSRSRQLRRIGEHEHCQVGGKFSVDIAWMTDVKWARLVTFFLLSMPRSRIIRLCRALESLLATNYFARTWIFQELFLGRSVSVCCGQYCVPISAIYGLAQASTFLASAWRIRAVDRAWRIFHPWTSAQQLRDYEHDWTKYYLWLLSAGSSPDPQPRDLGSLMWEIRYQDCGEIRDKVYGTLSMVDWPEDEAIPVNYDQDPFDLGIQVMEVIRKKPEGWDERWYDAADRVSQNLRLGAEPSGQLVEQIRKRHVPPESPQKFHSESACPELPYSVASQQHDTFWGYRLVKGEEQWAFENGSLPFSGFAEGREMRIRSWHIELGTGIGDETSEDVLLDDVFLPPVARPGDWCLMHTRGRPIHGLNADLTGFKLRFKMDRIILIARECCHDPAHPLSVIGKGLIHSNFRYPVLDHPVAAEFKVYFEDEDALLLAASASMVDVSRSGGLVEPEEVDMRVSESEASCYFNTAVCRRSYSTYAVRMEQKDGDEEFKWRLGLQSVPREYYRLPQMRCGQTVSLTY